MSHPHQNDASLPLRADPSSGALIGTFLLACWLAGPIGLLVAIWILIRGFGRRRHEPSL